MASPTATKTIDISAAKATFEAQNRAQAETRVSQYREIVTRAANDKLRPQDTDAIAALLVTLGLSFEHFESDTQAMRDYLRAEPADAAREDTLAHLDSENRKARIARSEAMAAVAAAEARERWCAGQSQMVQALHREFTELKRANPRLFAPDALAAAKCTTPGRSAAQVGEAMHANDSPRAF